MRREEVAELCHMSTDYYARLERQRGPQPSESMIASIAQGLHLSLDERDHLFRLGGHAPPARGTGAVGEHISPGLLRILDRLDDTPAEVVTELGETLRQTPLFASGLREVTALRGPGSRAAHYAELLLARSDEFRALWDKQEVGVRPDHVKRFSHPEVGALELNCQTLLDPDQSHRLLVYTAVPGSESHDRLRLLAVIGPQARALR